MTEPRLVPRISNPSLHRRQSNPVMQAIGEATLHVDEAATAAERTIGKKGLAIVGGVLALYGLGIVMNRDPAVYERNMQAYYASLPTAAHVVQPGDSIRYCARSQHFDVPPPFLKHDAAGVYANFVRTMPLNHLVTIGPGDALPVGATVHLPAYSSMNCQPHER